MPLPFDFRGLWAGKGRRHRTSRSRCSRCRGSAISLIHSDAIAADTAATVVSVESTAVALALNCDSADEVDSVFAEFVAAGATPASDPAYVFWVGYSAHVADLDGHLWEVAFNPGIPNDASGPMRLP